MGWRHRFFCSSFFPSNSQLIKKGTNLPPFHLAIEICTRILGTLKWSFFFSSFITCFSPARGYCNCALSHAVSNHQPLSAHHVTMQIGSGRRERITLSASAEPCGSLCVCQQLEELKQQQHLQGARSGFYRTTHNAV